MEVEEKRSKGGFFNLFDWNGKARKKLFQSTSTELPGNNCILNDFYVMHILRVRLLS